MTYLQVHKGRKHYPRRAALRVGFDQGRDGCWRGAECKSCWPNGRTLYQRLRKLTRSLRHYWRVYAVAAETGILSTDPETTLAFYRKSQGPR